MSLYLLFGVAAFVLGVVGERWHFVKVLRETEENARREWRAVSGSFNWGRYVALTEFRNQVEGRKEER